MNKQFNTLLKLITPDVIFIFIIMSFLEVFLISIFLSIFSENNIDIFNIFYFIKIISPSKEFAYLFSIFFILFNISSILYFQLVLIKKSQISASNLTELIFRKEINEYGIVNDLHSSETNKILLESVIRFSDGIVLPLYSLIQKLTAALLIIVIIFYYSLYYSLFFILGFSLFLMFINNFINKIFAKNNPKISELSLLRSKIISDGVSGKEMILSYRKQSFWEKLLSEPNVNLFKLRAQNAWLLTIPRALIEALIPTVFVMYFILKNTFDIEVVKITDVVPSIIIFFRLAPLLQLANANYNNLKSNKYALDELQRYHNLFDDLNRKPMSNGKCKSTEKLTSCKSINLYDLSIEIEGTQLHYPDMNLKMGKIYVVSGPSGVGKSLLLSLITGQIKPLKGQINYLNYQDDIILNPNEIDYRIMRQNDFLFSGTVAENIIFDDTLDTARKKLLSKLFIKLNLSPEITLQTNIDENANNISGGQAQRLHFIRCVSKPSSIYLLDEPSSALNSELENKMIEILEDLCVDSLVIIVSHSSNTLLNKFEQINLTGLESQSKKSQNFGEA